MRWLKPMAAQYQACSTNRSCTRPGRIEQALEQALTARTEIQQRWQLNQLRGLLLTLPSNGLSLDDSLRQLIRLLGTPMMNR
jgi:hypothetical protein